MDIIARDGTTMVFVEVKTREGQEFGDGAEAVTPLKRRRMTQIAMEYMAQQHLVDCPCRFDVVSIHVRDGRVAIELFANAFDAAF